MSTGFFALGYYASIDEMPLPHRRSGCGTLATLPCPALTCPDLPGTGVAHSMCLCMGTTGGGTACRAPAIIGNIGQIAGATIAA
ncbi:hypothetical protein D3C81_2008540 [compost metagenome]